MAEDKKNINSIKYIEFRCKKCNTKVTYDIDKKNKMIDHCYHCNEFFDIGDGYDNDPIQNLKKALAVLNKINNLDTSLICEE